MINVAKKYTKPTTEQEIEQLRKDIVQELAHWKNLRKYGCQDPFWPDGTNMNLVRNHIIYDKERLKELITDGNLPEEYYLPTPPEVDNNYLARQNEYFETRKERIESCPYDKITNKKPPNVNIAILELFEP